MDPISEIENLREEEAVVSKTIASLDANLRAIKNRQKYAQNLAEQERNDRDHRFTLRRCEEARIELRAIRGRIKTLNLKIQRELFERAQARKNNEVQ